MDRPPRDPRAPIFGARDIFLSLLQGSAVLLTVLAVFGLSLYKGDNEIDGRTLTFATLILGLVSLIFVNRSWSRNISHALRAPNRAFWWVVSGALGFLIVVLYVPYLREVFRFGSLRPIDLAVCLTSGIMNLALLVLLKSLKK